MGQEQRLLITLCTPLESLLILFSMLPGFYTEMEINFSFTLDFLVLVV